MQMAATLACVVALVYRQTVIAQSPAGLLLLIYWAISILLLGRDVAALARSLPAMRNTLLRFLELTESPEEHAGDLAPVARPGGAKIDIEEACVVVAGHVVLDRVTLHVPPVPGVRSAPRANADPDRASVTADPIPYNAVSLAAGLLLKGVARLSRSKTIMGHL